MAKTLLRLMFALQLLASFAAAQTGASGAEVSPEVVALKSHYADLMQNAKWMEAAKDCLKALMAAKKLEMRFALVEVASEIHKHDETQFVSSLVVEETAKTIDLLQASLDRPIVFSAEALIQADQEQKNQAPGQSISQQTQATLRLQFLEAFMRDIATLLHQRAKSSTQAHAYDPAIDSYRLYLQKFPKSPKSLDIEFNLAEAMFKGNRWIDAGNQYEVLAHDPRLAKRSTKFMESAIESFTIAVAHAGGTSGGSGSGLPGGLTTDQLHQARQGLRAAGEEWIKKIPQDPAAPTVAYNIANSWYEDHDYKHARDSFIGFIETYPQDSRVSDAVTLTFECFSQSDDPLGLEKFGKRMLKYSAKLKLNSKNVEATLHRSEVKALAGLAGTPTSAGYGDRLIALAEQFKDHDYGPMALHLAFENLKNKRDPKVFSLAETIIDQHDKAATAKPGNGSSPAISEADVKEALSTLATFALASAAYWQASEYLIRFATTYPQEPSAHDFMKTAADLEERIGNLKRARKLYLKLGDSVSVARVDFELRDWAQLEKSSAPLKSPDAVYWRALSIWRQHRFAEAAPALREAQSIANRDHAGHAKLLLAQLSRESFRQIKMKSAEDQAALAEKVKSFKAVVKELQAIVEGGVGRWPIAALDLIGETHMELGDFISSSPIPKGLKTEDKRAYVKVLYQQGSSYSAEAQKIFDKCVRLAESNDIFTRYVQACRSHGKIQVSDEDDLSVLNVETPGTEPAQTKSIRDRLLAATDKKTQVDLLFSLAEVDLTAKRPLLASVIINRILELDSTNARAVGYLGFADILRGDFDGGYISFKKALQFNPEEPTALWNLAGLYLHFEYKDKLSILKPRMMNVQSPHLIYEWPAKE